MRAIDAFFRLAGAGVSAAVARPGVADAARLAGERVAALLAAPAVPRPRPEPRRLAVCGHLAAAYAVTQPDIAAAFAALEPELVWKLRDIPLASPGFATGHASARILGPEGSEERGGLVAGFSLVAPGVTYPEHEHPPEEIYLVLSGGEWWQAGGAWHAPGAGGIVHNPPGIRHAMRGTGVPLLAVWFLLPG